MTGDQQDQYNQYQQQGGGMGGGFSINYKVINFRPIRIWI